jgi:hypothetical protein
VRFEVLTAASLKMTVFSDIAPGSLVAVDRRFRGAYCLHDQGSDHCPDDGSSKLVETSVNFYVTVWCNALDDCLLHIEKCFK